MAEVLLSPGVLARENDNTFISAQPIQAGAAILGPTVKGPVGIPTLVSSYSDYQNKFGTIVESGSAEYTYFTSISAYNYFQQGGDSLLVTRVVSGSYTSATSTNVGSGIEGTSLVDLTSAAAFKATGSALGTFAVSSSNTNVTASIILDTTSSFSSTSVTAAVGTFNVGDTVVFTSQSLGATAGGGTDLTFTLVDADIANENVFTLETLTEGTIANSGTATGANGTLTNGTKDNLRWEIVQPDTAKGTFSLLIRRGNDTTTSKTVLETWADLSLDPNASNYIEKVIGNSKQVVANDGSDYYIKNEGTYNTLSSFVRVKSVDKKTLNYFDNNGSAKAEFTGSIPLAGSGSFTGATGAPFVGRTGQFYENIDGTDTQGLVSDNYTNSLNLLANKDLFSYNVITTPGLTRQNHSSPLTTLVNNAQTRGDNLAVIDLREYNSTLSIVTAGASSVDSSYAATYWPWLQTLDPDLGSQVWVPASTMIPGVYAFNDRAGEAWFAPAGLNRGGLSTVLRTERALTNGNRDTLYGANVNPIATFPNTGVVVFGQKTLQKKASALDRVNVRRLLIALKNFISQIADNLVFEQNTIATRNNFLSQVNPYLESVQQRQGLYAFKVVMDETNNTPDVIDRNQLIGQIYIQPTRTAEFIYLDFNVQPTGATFPA
jgi:hypothetical protein